MQVVRANSSEGASGERVSNAWITYPDEGDNHSKGWLIPHTVLRDQSRLRLALQEGFTCY